MLALSVVTKFPGEINIEQTSRNIAKSNVFLFFLAESNYPRDNRIYR